MSVSIVFIEFCGIIVWNLIPLKSINCFKRKSDWINNNHRELDTVQILEYSDYNDRSRKEQYVCFHDSITADDITD